jgi:hypothetical protein
MASGQTELVNIGPKETRKRMVMGIVMVVVGGVLAVVLSHAGVSRGWYFWLLLPFSMGTFALCQARKKT